MVQTERVELSSIGYQPIALPLSYIWTVGLVVVAQFHSVTSPIRQQENPIASFMEEGGRVERLTVSQVPPGSNRFPSHLGFTFLGSPSRIRTGVPTVRGLDPSPLEDRAIMAGCTGIEPVSPTRQAGILAVIRTPHCSAPPDPQ